MKYFNSSGTGRKLPIEEHFDSWKQVALFLNEELNSIYLDTKGVLEEIEEFEKGEVQE